MRDTFEVGDEVDIYIGKNVFSGEILHIPQYSGDCFHIRDYGNLVYIQHFDYMEESKYLCT